MRIRRRCFVNSSKTTRGSQKRQPRATGSTASWPMGRSIPKRNRAHRCKRASSASIKQLASDRHDSHLASSLFFFILLYSSLFFFILLYSSLFFFILLYFSSSPKHQILRVLSFIVRSARYRGSLARFS